MVALLRSQEKVPNFHIQNRETKRIPIARSLLEIVKSSLPDIKSFKVKFRHKLPLQPDLSDPAMSLKIIRNEISELKEELDILIPLEETNVNNIDIEKSHINLRKELADVYYVVIASILSFGLERSFLDRINPVNIKYFKRSPDLIERRDLLNQIVEEIDLYHQRFEYAVEERNPENVTENTVKLLESIWNLTVELGLSEDISTFCRIVQADNLKKTYTKKEWRAKKLLTKENQSVIASVRHRKGEPEEKIAHYIKLNKHKKRLYKI